MAVLIQQRVDTAVESICRRGCRAVRACIAQLEHGGEVAETRGLGVRERAQVLDELKAVMAVYAERPGEADSPLPASRRDPRAGDG
jgi:hypothetical protein